MHKLIIWNLLNIYLNFRKFKMKILIIKGAKKHRKYLPYAFTKHSISIFRATLSIDVALILVG